MFVVELMIEIALLIIAGAEHFVFDVVAEYDAAAAAAVAVVVVAAYVTYCQYHPFATFVLKAVAVA